MAEAAAALTVADALSWATGQLSAAGCETPRLDAELLLAEALGVGRERLILEPDREVDRAVFDPLIARRLEREPIAYVLGRKDFRRITLAVDRRALIPRPETELLVEVGLGLEQGARVADVGTGSGAVALALKDERPDLEVWGVDASTEAVELARENARSLGLDVQFDCGDLLEGAPGRFDAVLANLPYVAVGTELQPEIERYEPREALFAGQDGLSVIRRLVGATAGVPVVALEVGFDQAGAVAALMREAGWRPEVLRDLTGHERVVIGRR